MGRCASTVRSARNCATAIEDVDISPPPTLPPIYRSIPLANGQGRIIIERWTLSDEPRLRNIARRAADGSLVWRAALPETPGRECFVAMRRVGDAVLATTYQGVEVLIDIETGLHLASRRSVAFAA